MAPKKNTSQSPPAATRRSGLSRDSILDAAAQLVDRVGYGQFSMRGLGAELGVEAMSVYHHFPSKAHIGDALLGRLLQSIAPVNPDLPWLQKLRAACYAYRAAILRHPGFATFALTHRMNTLEGLAYVEQIVLLIAEGGFAGQVAAQVFRSLGYYLSGALLDETAGYAQGAGAADPLAIEQQRVIAPCLVGLGPWFQAEYWEQTFEFGLSALLVRFEALRASSQS